MKRPSLVEEAVRAGGGGGGARWWRWRRCALVEVEAVRAAAVVCFAQRKAVEGRVAQGDSRRWFSTPESAGEGGGCGGGKRWRHDFKYSE